jgi:hypothetical protein
MQMPAGAAPSTWDKGALSWLAARVWGAEGADLFGALFSTPSATVKMGATMGVRFPRSLESRNAGH